MAKPEKLFVIINPTLVKHVALERAIHIANSASVKPQIVVFISVDATRIEDKPSNENLHRDHDWLEKEICAPLKLNNVNFDILFSWCSNWADSLMQVAESVGATMILMRRTPTIDSYFQFNFGKWNLFKNSKCPVLLVNGEAKTETGVVLAAVKWQTHDGEQKLLNRKILESAKAASTWCSNQLHVVNAYKDSISYPDRGSLLRNAGVANSNIHIVQGESTKVIASAAIGTEANLVVVGTKGHSYYSSKIHPAKIERLLSLIDVDVLVVNSK
jgi:universal stress protein E